MGISAERWWRLRKAVLDQPVDIASLAGFRMLFGFVMAAAMVRFLAKGWVAEFYTRPAFHFPYSGFEWVRALPEGCMQGIFALLALAAICVAIGFCYRLCITLFFIGFTYIELIDQTLYLNHYYLVSLLSGLMIFLPANGAWSMDALRRPEIRSDVAPAWTLNLLRFQVAVVYIFAGLAKLNADWLLQAQPLRIWLAARSDLPIVGPLLDQTWVAFAASWFGAAFDLTIVFLLLCARTRKTAYAAVIVFHLATLALFNIGMFPCIMIASATLFFAPGWPRRFIVVAQTDSLPHRRLETCPTPKLTCALLAIYAAVQLALPLRPYLQSQPAAWTCHGFNLAWQVMIAEKTGYVEFTAADPLTNEHWRVPLNDLLTPRQQIMMAQDPDLIRAMARHLARMYSDQGRPVEIRCEAFASFNGRPAQRLIDPTVNLAGPLPREWVVRVARL